jgi:hypothetical protein
LKTLNNNESSFSFNELNESSFDVKKNSVAVTAKNFNKRKISVPVCAQSNFLRTAPLFVDGKFGASEAYAPTTNIEYSNKRDQSPLTPRKFMQMKQRV